MTGFNTILYDFGSGLLFGPPCIYNIRIYFQAGKLQMKSRCPNFL